VKTLISGLYQIQHFYKSAKPHDLENSFVFHILGIDIFLDKNLKIWLLEVNQSPSFMTDSPLDYSVKKNLICDSLHMLNLSQKRKNKYVREEKNDIERRLRGQGKISQQEKEQLRQKKLMLKDKFENSNMGDFQNLYPLRLGVCEEDDKLMEKYELFQRKSKEL
jgi:tubulin polyglutamylase TTLL6/13